MDYEKKDFRKLYEDLVKSDWFKKAYHDKSLGDCPFDIPELRESEDERIRKELIEFIREAYSTGNVPEKCAKWLVWLEKQKEQPTNEEMLRTLHAEYEKGVADTIAKYEQKEQKLADYPYLPGWRKNRDDNKPELKRSVLMLTTHGVAEGEWLGEKWCQYRWSCELKDGEVLYWTHLSDLERLEKEDEEKQKETHYTKRNALFDKCVAECEEIMQLVSDEIDEILGKEQKPAEIAPNQFDGITYGMQGYSTEKPAEWSEEDEDMLKHIISDLREFRDCETDEELISDYEDEISWLKSLRPQWRPSGEQIGALNYAYCELFKRGDVGHNILGSLQKLIDQLREQM